MNAASKFQSDFEAREKVFNMIKDIRIALLVTQDQSGHLFARPMAAQKQDKNGDLWFFTEKNSPKIIEIEYNPDVLLSYSNPDDQNYVSISGTARIVHDKAKIDELWSEMLATWFPKGKDDPNIALICVTPESAEYWDAPSSTFLHAYGYVKAKLTGERPQGGENQKVKFAS